MSAELETARGLLREFLLANAVTMGDSTVSTKLCTACEMRGTYAHDVCGCVCHRAREFLAAAEAVDPVFAPVPEPRQEAL